MKSFVRYLLVGLSFSVELLLHTKSYGNKSGLELSA